MHSPVATTARSDLAPWDRCSGQFRASARRLRNRRCATVALRPRWHRRRSTTLPAQRCESLPPPRGRARSPGFRGLRHGTSVIPGVERALGRPYPLGDRIRGSRSVDARCGLRRRRGRSAEAIRRERNQADHHHTEKCAGGERRARAARRWLACCGHPTRPTHEVASGTLFALPRPGPAARFSSNGPNRCHAARASDRREGPPPTDSEARDPSRGSFQSFPADAAVGPACASTPGPALD